MNHGAKRSITRVLVFSGVAAILLGIVLVVLVVTRPADLAVWPTPADEMHVAMTSDGYALPLYRFVPRGSTVAATPVIMVHGLGANRHNFIGPGNQGLARYLADAGFDVFVAELRGAGLAEGLSAMSGQDLKWRFTFDTYVERDAPAILARVAALTGSTEVDWIGHSMGAMIGYGVLGDQEFAQRTPLIRRFISLAGPSVIEVEAEQRRHLKLITAWPFAKFPNGQMLRYLSPWLARRSLPEEIPALGRTAHFDSLFLQQAASNVPSNIAIGVLRQFDRWVQSGQFTSADGGIDYLERLKSSQVPSLFIVGEIDRLCSVRSIRLAYDALETMNKQLIIAGLETGFRIPYGHSDIVLGSDAPEEIFPLVKNWLSTNAAVAETTY